MIQKLNDRRRSAALAPHRENTSLDADGPETWGSWYNRRFYSLSVVQEPIRARMCGFGDKDRRPLAPATVARLVIKTKIKHSDLWSIDGLLDRNLVLHPTSSDRYSTAHAPKKRRPNHPVTPYPGEEASSQAGAPTSKYPMRLPVEDQMNGLSHVPTRYDGGGYPFTHAQQDAGGNSIALQPTANYNSVAADQDLAYHAGTTAQATQTYPSGLSTGMAGPPPISPVPAAGWHSNGVSAPQDASTNGYRPWGSSPQYETLDAQGHPSIPSTSHTPLHYQSIELQEGQPTWSQPVSPPSHTRVFTAQSGPARPPQEMHVSQPEAGPSPNHISPEQSMYASASIAQQQMREAHQLSPSSSSSPVANAPLPGHVYTRTLVGPLSANACRLLDEHRAPGVFFLFQDLSIRTEGSVPSLTRAFKFRYVLTRFGIIPAPENGALQVHNNVSPILAQTYTQAFDVYSAKRFPGVPAFGNQGQKLPLRNRHGSSKHGRRRRRAGSDGSEDDDSDGG
ncbi:velvet factor-domain-containing protein [Russula vinacea]|nr:velvet factor-domain-containing protein [Russula vinacea]